MVDAVEQEAECRRIMQDPSALEAFLQDLPNSAGALDLIGSCAKECTPNKRLLALTAVPTLLLILQGDGEPADAVQQALLAIYNLEIKMTTERPFPLRSILTQPTCYSSRPMMSEAIKDNNCPSSWEMTDYAVPKPDLIVLNNYSTLAVFTTLCRSFQAYVEDIHSLRRYGQLLTSLDYDRFDDMFALLVSGYVPLLRHRLANADTVRAIEARLGNSRHRDLMKFMLPPASY